jgi:hypothetical protein
LAEPLLEGIRQAAAELRLAEALVLKPIPTSDRWLCEGVSPTLLSRSARELPRDWSTHRSRPLLPAIFGHLLLPSSSSTKPVITRHATSSSETSAFIRVHPR